MITADEARKDFSDGVDSHEPIASRAPREHEQIDGE
jgi:hypothetical protein